MIFIYNSLLYCECQTQLQKKSNWKMLVISISYYLEVPVDKISDIDVNVIISKGVQHSF